jgi:DNA primase
MGANRAGHGGRQLSRDEIERIRDAHPVEAVVGRYVSLRRAGRRFVGFCPFHDDRRTPSLVVFPESGRWWCFGACNDGGDVFDFVMRSENVAFPQAVRRLGGGTLSPPRAAPPPPLKGEGVEQRVLDDAHYALLTTAVEVYHAALLANPHALAYTSSRGLDADTVRSFRLGFAAGRLKRYLAFRGWSEELAADLGLVDSRGREWYRGRLVIPELRGDRAVYLVGRTVPGVRAFGPKYLTLAGAPKPLYGRERVAGRPEVFVVEGPIDYLLLWQWGYPAVATLGSRIKREHVEVLQEFPLVYLVPHRDDAGRQMWRECRAAFGERLHTVLVPEEMKDVGDLAEKAPAPARAFARMVDEAR